MKLSTISLCVLAVVLWAGVDALAQGKGKGKDEQAPVKNNAAKVEKVQEDSRGAGGMAGKDPAKADKDKAAKRIEDGVGGPKGKQGGPQGKKIEQASDAVEKGKGKGRQQQLQAFEKQLQHEQAKNMERNARLARIRELAVQKGDTETVARVDKLIAKQKQVYDRKLQRVQGQPRATQQPGATGTEGVTVQAPASAPSTDKPTEVSGGDANKPGQ